MKRTLLLMIFGIGLWMIGWGQQVIGSFPVMDGGFENQSGTLANTLSSSLWSRQSGTGSTITSTGGRSGPKYVTATVAASNRLLQSPQDATAANGPAASTAYRVQFFYKSSAAFNVFQIGVSINGTSSPTYSTGTTLASTSGVWTKYEGTVTTPGGTVTTAGIGIIRGGTGASGGPIDVDDFVIYAGALDNTAPGSPGTVTVGNPSISSLDVSWVAAVSVDGGGYVVVRYASDPGTGNDPNQNGIYAIGNAVATGGTVRYIGTGTNFTDNVGLSSGTQYWYKVYTVDKAFNYSVESSGTGTTTSTSTTPPSLNADVTNNNVDNNIDITFTDDATWRDAVTAVIIGGTALTVTTDYVLTEGNLQLKPSGGNSLLTTSGSKSVTVEATGYSVASVTQVINAGADNKLEIITQPAAPATNGAILGIQPVVAIRDQYGNATTSTANVVAAVNAGTWNIGGNLTIAGVSGTATFTDLTATSIAAVTGANIDFTSTGLTHIVSNNFDIPAPPPQIDWANLQWPASGNINLGSEFNVYAQVNEPGITDATGQGAGISCWIGYSTLNTNPNTWTNWVAATYNSDNGNNDEYKANIGAVITPAGTYYYASRFQLGAAAFVYGGYNSGFWDGTTNVSGTLTINPPPQIDWANLQSPASGNINTGGTFNVYAQVYEADLTNPVGQGAGINAWIGYHTANTDPSTWTNWIAASYNADAGNNDEYMANIATALPAGTYYYASRFKYGLADYVYGGYSSGGGNFWDGTNYVSGVLTISTPEPTNYPTLFAAVANSSSQITITWTDATDGQTPDAYLVKAAVDPTTPTAPSDGTAEGDATLIKNIAQGTQQAVFTGLNSSTTYIFEIWPYKGTGSAINYRTDGSVPQTSAKTFTESVYTTINFDDDAKWTAGSVALTSYASNHTYIDGLFSATGGPALRNTTTAQDGFAGALGTYSWRVTNAAASWIITIASGGIGDFSIDIRRWDNSPSPAYTLDYSINGGTDWVNVATIDNTSLGNSSNWKTFNGTINNGVSNVLIRLNATGTTERIMIDNFKWTDYSSTYSGTGNWTTLGNWSKGVPTSTMNALISGTLTVDDMAVCKNLTISTTGAVTVSSGQGLSVNGNFLIESDATGTGSFIGASDDYDITGTINIERYLSKYNDVEDDMYHFISSPVAEQVIFTDLDDLYRFSEISNYWINRESTGVPEYFVDVNFVVGKGYMVANATDITKSFAGNLNSYPDGSPLILTCTYTDGKGNGWNLLGNPFPSAIDWTLVSRGDGMDDALYYYDASQQKYRYYIQIDGDDVSLGSGSQYIPAMQGFMVHAKSTGTKTVTMDNLDRVHNGQNIYYKSSNTVPGSLSLMVTSGEFSDETFVHFNGNATSQFDGKYDAYKLSSYNTHVPELYTQSSDDEKLAINGLPELSETTEIPVYYKAGIEGQQNITADLSNIESKVFLVDKKTNITHNLTQNPVYAFTSASGDDPNRFELKFGMVGIDDPANISSVNAYFFDGKLFVNTMEKNCRVNIFNANGQQLDGFKLAGEGLQSVALRLPAGIYMAQIMAGNTMQTVKFVVQ